MRQLLYRYAYRQEFMMMYCCIEILSTALVTHELSIYSKSVLHFPSKVSKHDK